MKKLLIPFVLLFLHFNLIAEESDSLTIEAPDSLQVDSLFSEIMKAYEIEKNLKYENGSIDIASGVATLNVPDGFKFLDAEQSQTVLTDLWGNPPSFNTLGMLFPEKVTPLGDSFTYAVEITYSEEGYIEDEDAEDLDYDELLKDMQEGTIEENESRREQGYAAIELVGWAQPPYYDQETKKLHWAKELKFEGSEESTLNYNIRILGRKGVLVLNIIGDMDQLETLKPDVETILSSVDFNEGNQYDDFDPEIDKVAAYGIGGLIAGKVLAKTGFLALIGKFGKFIILGIVAAFAGLRKMLFGKKDDVKEDNIEGPKE